MNEFISASKARELSNKSIQDSINEQLDPIFAEIKKACSRGEFEIKYIDGILSADALSTLRHMGYTVCSDIYNSLLEEDSQNVEDHRITMRYIISWLEVK